MKTLRNLVKGGHIEEKGRRSRKVSLPAQRYAPESFEIPRDQKPPTLWQNVKRKISFSIAHEEPEKIEDICESRKQNECTNKEIRKLVEEELTDSPRLRRVNSDVAEEDVMHFAIIEGDLELLKGVLRSKVNVNYLRPPGTAALHQACIVGNLEIVEMLVKNGANINVRDHMDLTPLQLANCHGHFDIAEYLLRMGSPVTDIKDGFQIERRRRKRSFGLKWFHKRGQTQETANETSKDGL